MKNTTIPLGKTLYFLLMFGLLIWGSSCERVIDLELDGVNNPVFIIQGEVIDREGRSYVRIQKSQDYYDISEAPLFSGAEVIIRDDRGGEFRFEESSEIPGNYFPADPNFKGEIDVTYSMEVNAEGKTYRSSSKMPPNAEIDSLVIRFQKASIFRDEGYYFYFFGKEPQERKDWYRWKTYKNDSLYDGPDDILIADDEFVQGEIDNLEFPYNFELGDTIRLEQYATTEEVFEYYDGLLDVIFNDGGLFSPPPVNPPTNIEGNNVTGVFSAASMIDETVIVEDEE